jgi:hypothetical protein
VIVVYDIETLKRCFTYTALDVANGEIYQYVLHQDRFELDELMQHLKKCRGGIGFNNKGFDYPVLHHMIEAWNAGAWNALTREQIITIIYTKAQEVIRSTNDSAGRFGVVIPRFQEHIVQCDLFRMWHYTNKAKSTSLKGLEISMNFPNVMDMPIKHDVDEIGADQIDDILKYNLNDVLATNEFYKKSREKIDLRKAIDSRYQLGCLNYNNGKIGEELILKLYCERTGKDPRVVRQLRTHRDSINLAECIPHNVSFTTPQFNSILDYFRGKVITTTKGAIEKSIIYKGIRYDYGTGGIHACISSGVYMSDDYYIIKTCDVASLYPNLAIVYGLFIEHLGVESLYVYDQDIVALRMAEKKKPKAEQDKAIVDGFKEAANIFYGKSNDVNSFLYDPLYSMKTTIAGQLVLSMLCERLSEIPDSQILMVNTDGLEIRIPRKHEELYDKICKDWETLTKLTLEFDTYSKMAIRDVNNYLAETTSGKVKTKGAFEVDKVVGSEPAYHKDNSFRVVPLAVQEYFTEGIPIADTIKNHYKNGDYKTSSGVLKNHGIYDFCGRQKFGHDSTGEIHVVEQDKNGNFNKITIPQQKNTRYYISSKGALFTKRYSKGTIEAINKGYVVTIFNEFRELPWNEYDINYDFYISEAEKIIREVEGVGQLSLL